MFFSMLVFPENSSQFAGPNKYGICDEKKKKAGPIVSNAGRNSLAGPTRYFVRTGAGVYTIIINPVAEPWPVHACSGCWNATICCWTP